jgi:hypothetical protein
MRVNGLRGNAQWFNELPHRYFFDPVSQELPQRRSNNLFFQSHQVQENILN